MACHSTTTSIWWIRGHDLRLHDNAALRAAAEGGGSRILPVFLWCPADEGHLGIRGAIEAWTKFGLLNLDADIRQHYGGAVFFGAPNSTHIEAALAQLPEGEVAAREAARRSPSLSLLFLVARAANATKVFTCGRAEPHIRRAQDLAAPALLGAGGIAFREFDDYLLYPREQVDCRPPEGWHGHFGTLMPFYRTATAAGQPRAPLPPPARETRWATGALAPALQGLAAPGAAALASMAAVPRGGPDWARALADAWGGEDAVSERAGRRLVDQFVTGPGLRDYERSRGRADLTAQGRAAVSRLSPYIRAGQVSPRVLHHAWRAQSMPRQLTKTFGRRLFWRDLAYWLLRVFPHMPERPIRPHYAATRWRRDRWVLRAWQCGMTGFPLVDAAMRELWATGWIQQNVRMAAACFLTEFANVDWVHGARWFHFTLADADVAINSMMWQNAGRSGTDQWNFTIAPTSAAADPTGAYVRRWLPELAGVPTRHLHAPWEAPATALAAARVCIGPPFGDGAGAFGEHARRYQDEAEPAPTTGGAACAVNAFTGPQPLPRDGSGAAVYPARILDDLERARRDTWGEVVRMRRAAGDGGNDAGGYDIVPLPGGRRTRVFTRVPFRLPRGGRGTVAPPRRKRPSASKGGVSRGADSGADPLAAALGPGAGVGAIERALRRAAELKRCPPSALAPRPGTAPAASDGASSPMGAPARRGAGAREKPPRRRQARIQHFFS